MKKRNLTLLTAFAAAAAFASTAQAALIITVFENTATTTIDFSWNGIIGASGTATGTLSGSGDQIVPNTGNFQTADRSRSDVSDTGGGGWSPGESYAGSTSLYGSGISFSAFAVTSNIPLVVHNDNTLRVGHITAGGGTFPDLATQVFTGSFSLPGDFSTYGLFDTGPTALPTPLWTASSGSGSISFEAIPEPSAALLLGVAGMGLLVRRRRA